MTLKFIFSTKLKWNLFKLKRWSVHWDLTVMPPFYPITQSIENFKIKTHRQQWIIGGKTRHKKGEEISLVNDFYSLRASSCSFCCIRSIRYKVNFSGWGSFVLEITTCWSIASNLRTSPPHQISRCKNLTNWFMWRRIFFVFFSFCPHDRMND